MLIADDWLPAMIELADYDGNWQRYVDAVYDRYLSDLDRRRVLFLDRPVTLRYHTPTDGKGSGFWHCIQEGAIESERIPEMERCKRIGWIKAIIEHWNAPGVDYWQELRRGEIDHLLWWQETYLIVLGERGVHAKGGPAAYLLKTAYLVIHKHQRRKRCESRDAWKKLTPPRGTASNTPTAHGS